MGCKTSKHFPKSALAEISEVENSEPMSQYRLHSASDPTAPALHTCPPLAISKLTKDLNVARPHILNNRVAGALETPSANHAAASALRSHPSFEPREQWPAKAKRSRFFHKVYTGDNVRSTASTDEACASTNPPASVSKLASPSSEISPNQRTTPVGFANRSDALRCVAAEEASSCGAHGKKTIQGTIQGTVPGKQPSFSVKLTTRDAGEPDCFTVDTRNTTGKKSKNHAPLCVATPPKPILRENVSLTKFNQPTSTWKQLPLGPNVLERKTGVVAKSCVGSGVAALAEQKIEGKRSKRGLLLGDHPRAVAKLESLDYIKQGGNQLSSYEAIVCHQRAILPAHLQNSKAYSEIILESSIVVGCLGQMVMLPWNDQDEDARHNYWINSPPAYIKEALEFLREASQCHQKLFKAQQPRSQNCSIWQNDRSEETFFTLPFTSFQNVECNVLNGLESSCSSAEDERCFFGSSSSVSDDHALYTVTANACASSPMSDNGDLSSTSPFIRSTIDSRGRSVPGVWASSSLSTGFSFSPGSCWSTESESVCRADTLCPDGLPVVSARYLKKNIKNTHGTPTQTHGQCMLSATPFSGNNEKPLGHCHLNSTQPTATPPLFDGLCTQQHPSFVCRMNAIELPSLECTPALLSQIADFSNSLFCEGWSLKDGRWTDPDGYIGLSQKQKSKFYAWRRITDLSLAGSDVPCVIQDRPKSRSIRQGFVGDCSFLSSLAVLAQYENVHRVPVISSIIHPQQLHPSCPGHAVPLINPTGYYACRVFFNGVPRKVVLDDYVPVRKDGKVLSAHSSKKNEFWVSLLEKCFVKLMGGSYFMQGSNPGADLYHLTGWIPETIPFRVDIHTGSPDNHTPVVTGGHEAMDYAADPKWNAVWDQLFDGLQYGKCVACLGTSEVADAAPSGLDYPEGVSQSSGIVARHAYSVLGFRSIGGRRLLFVKNPWCCIRWRGNYSPYDERNWTERLEAELRYNRKRSAAVDDGCFWIEWSDVVKWFSHLYICWTPSCFPFHTEIHSKWERTPYMAHSILPDDSHVVPFNPQFLLSVHPEQEEGLLELWIFLSRHVRERKRDLSLKYLAIHVHSGSERLSCPPPPIKQGVYSNGECTLVKLVLDLSPQKASPFLSEPKTSPNKKVPLSLGLRSAETNTNDQNENNDDDYRPTVLRDSRYVLVVSQYSQKEEFNFTIKAYSSIRTTLTQLPPLIPPESSSTSRYLKGAWDSATAGGCSNSLWSYFTNPHVRLYLPYDCDVLLLLECPQERSVNLRLFQGAAATARVLRSGKAISSGPYRSGCCVIQKRLSAGCHTIVVSTFRQGETGEFQVSLHLWNAQAPVTNGKNEGKIVSTCDLKPQFWSTEPVLQFLPYPYVVTSPSYYQFFHHEVHSRHGFSDTDFRLSGFGGALEVSAAPNVKSDKEPQFINVALRLNTRRMSPSTIYPSIVVYRQRMPDDKALPGDDADCCWVPPPSNALVPVARSDLEGGQSDVSRLFSSAAHDLYKKQNVSMLSHVCLTMKDAPYYIVITPALIIATNQASPYAVVPVDSPKTMHPIAKDATSGDFTLNVISDHPLTIRR